MRTRSGPSSPRCSSSTSSATFAAPATCGRSSSSRTRRPGQASLRASRSRRARGSARARPRRCCAASSRRMLFARGLICRADDRGDPVDPDLAAARRPRGGVLADRRHSRRRARRRLEAHRVGRRPVRVTICDVGPRDGLQNEPEVLAPIVRAELVSRLVAAQVPRVEAVSFVRGDLVPQMNGAEEVVSAVKRRAGVELSGLVLNERGSSGSARSGSTASTAGSRRRRPSIAGTRMRRSTRRSRAWRRSSRMRRCRSPSPCRARGAVRSRGRSTRRWWPRCASAWRAPMSSSSPTRSASRRRAACCGSSSACRFSVRRSAPTCTTRATPATRARGRRSRRVPRFSTPPSAVSAAARSRRRQRGEHRDGGSRLAARA